MGEPRHAFHQRTLYAALIVHAVTAWFSSGYYAADEHYQVIAFAQHKLGELPAGELPWEYGAHMRSAFLPGIAYSAIVACRAWLTSDPFIIAFVLRLLTALFALIVVRSFVRAAMPQVADRLQGPFILLSYFLWFLPYQHVRFASETWAGLLFLLGLAQLVGERNRWSMLATGLCFGLSMQVKPVMGLACLGAMVWSLFTYEKRRSQLLHLSAGLIAALALGILADHWFYGAWAPTLWNYMRLAVAGDPAHTFESYPWYYYFPWMLKYGIWPIGILLVGALMWVTYRLPRSWTVWCVWPYLIVLSVIPHKELRFLFPLVDLVPFALVLAWQELEKTTLLGEFRAGWQRRVLIAGAAFLILVNMTALITAGLTAAGSGRARLAEVLHGIHPSDPMTLGYTLNEPGIWRIRVPTFYLVGDFVDAGTFDPCSTPSFLNEQQVPVLLIAPFDDGSGSGCTVESGGYRPFARSEAAWATSLLELYNNERHGPYVLYRIDPAPSHPSEP